MNKQQLANKIWESANKMRSNIEANEYKDYILGFIFYKFLSDKEVQFLKENNATDEYIAQISETDPETVAFIQEKLGYFISYDNLFSTWLSLGNDFDVSNVRDALSAFNRKISDKHKKIFEGIFTTLETGLSKLGNSPGSQTKAVNALIHLIKDIPMDNRQDYDVLGFIYEYLISMFAANAGKKAGEFYTPHEVSLLMSEIVAEHLKGKKTIDIYDPTSGSGSLLITIGRSAAKHIEGENKVRYYAQELKKNTYNLTRMNLVMRGILPDNIVTRCGDTLDKKDWPYFEDNDPVGTYSPLYVDAVVSNPPYSQHWETKDMENDVRYKRFGVAPKTKADYAFLLHDLYHLKPEGIMTIVLPHGVLFRGGEEGNIRRNLVEFNHIDAIISLPSNIFFGTGIATIVMVLKQKRANDDVLIIDASKGFVKEGKNNKLRASDIKRIVDTYVSRATVPKFSRAVSREEIRENAYNLNIPRYVDSSNEAEHWDLYALMYGGIPASEVAGLSTFWDAFPSLRSDLFSAGSNGYLSLATDDVRGLISSHADVCRFTDGFTAAFSDFGTCLRAELVDAWASVNTANVEAVLSGDIFSRLSCVPLIDTYAAYQILDDCWQRVAVDLGILQSEGFAAARKVVPNMVLKKKEGKDVEVQDGWLGYVLPFELVQETLLKEDMALLSRKEERLSVISSEVADVLSSLSEEELESEAVNKAKDAFAAAAAAKEAKQIRAEMKRGAVFDADSLEQKLLTVNALLDEEKGLKKQVKADAAHLHELTIQTIEQLSDAEVLDLLERKWILPLTSALSKMPEDVVSDLTSGVKYLSEKYAVTFSETEESIHEAECSLSVLIGELEGAESDMAGLMKLKSLLAGE
ncbi:type I restriction-modification system subunit M [Methanogenium marinum]|uniref:site-specific DNA-methyltransferase (adenine-specific) n=1 Tax=Methanogenium marinum TaxID=348610 RepID=A0A9Q4PYY2_9EURY|nr:type I restriction-modification system subunit M [Methanogenium marinum]MDE4908967.1 type I restriction-modification system subunit M [Methanogenium marinum]